MRILGVCSYKGTNYYGWQKQVGFVSVQSTIEEVLSKVYDSPISITGSGRTDAGVHALRQYFHFDTEKEKDLKQLAYSLNKMLPEDIKILSFERVADDFHARYNAKRKVYEYRIVLKNKDPFQDQLAFVYPMELDFDLFKTIRYSYTFFLALYLAWKSSATFSKERILISSGSILFNA